MTPFFNFHEIQRVWGRGRVQSKARAKKSGVTNRATVEAVIGVVRSEERELHHRAPVDRKGSLS